VPSKECSVVRVPSGANSNTVPQPLPLHNSCQSRLHRSCRTDRPFRPHQRGARRRAIGAVGLATEIVERGFIAACIQLESGAVVARAPQLGRSVQIACASRMTPPPVGTIAARKGCSVVRVAAWASATDATSASVRQAATLSLWKRSKESSVGSSNSADAVPWRFALSAPGTAIIRRPICAVCCP